MIKGHISLPLDMDVSILDWQDHCQCYQQTPETEKYFNRSNSSIWQMFDESPPWVHQLAQLVPQDFEHHVVSVVKVNPGNTVPWHQDKHYILQQKFGTGDTWRYLIFLEDWKIGHYFQIGDTPIVQWQAGDYIKFHKQDWHLGGNMGLHPFYTAQVTILNVDKT